MSISTHDPNLDQASVTFHLTGQVQSADFPGWMARHAHKLGVMFQITQSLPRRIDVTAQGAPEMLDAFALACSLGPQSVNVDALHITAPKND